MNRRLGTVFSKRDLTPLGRCIEQERLACGLSREALENDARIGHATLDRIYHKPDYSPSVAVVQRIANAVGLPLWSLFKGLAE